MAVVVGLSFLGVVVVEELGPEVLADCFCMMFNIIIIIIIGIMVSIGLTFFCVCVAEESCNDDPTLFDIMLPLIL